MKKHLIAVLQLIPVFISMLLITAHFLRAHNILLVVISLLLPFGLLIRHPLSARIMQGALVLTAIEWTRTIFIIASYRSDIGHPWTRLAIILGAVACFTLASALVFFSKTLKERYRLIKYRG